MPVHRYKYFTPSDAARMSKLHLRARQVVEGVITGLHKSPHRGFSVEFSEHREYCPGDEIRRMDWKAYARSDRHYIKLYEQETNLRAMLVLDNSASMKFAGKFEYARRLAACLAYLLAAQQDLAGLSAVDQASRVDLPPGSTPVHLDRLFVELEKFEPGTTADLSGRLHDLAERLPRRSLVILLSDLWTDVPEFVRALGHLRHRKHQGVVLHLLDKAEIELPYQGQVSLMDLETGQTLQVDAAEIGPHYRDQVAAHLEGLRKACNDCDVEYSAIDVAEPYTKALVRWLSGRR